MAASGTVPLYLFQVLEQEYAALYGEDLPNWSWKFEPTHIRETRVSVFVSALEPHQAETTSAALDPDRAAAHKLHEYLQAELNKHSDLSKKLREAPDTQAVANALNLFLGDANLFSEERFSQYWLNTATRNLRDVRYSLSAEERQHFNRLLLEDAFPDIVLKIHRLRLGAIYERMHAKKQTALCLSGGGIRSGTFA